MPRSSIVGAIGVGAATLAHIAMITWNFIWMGLGGQVSGWVQLTILLIPTALAASLTGLKFHQIYKKIRPVPRETRMLTTVLAIFAALIALGFIAYLAEGLATYRIHGWNIINISMHVVSLVGHLVNATAAYCCETSSHKPDQTQSGGETYRQIPRDRGNESRDRGHEPRDREYERERDYGREREYDREYGRENEREYNDRYDRRDSYPRNWDNYTTRF
ncbi:hypothetical protein ACHWQZ_G015014 [Mnemiopsis leidyi]